MPTALRSNRQTERLLAQIRVELPKLLEDTGFNRNVCILATRISLHALSHFGVPARALETKVAVMNEGYMAAAEEISDKPGLDTAERMARFQSRGAWRLDIGNRLEIEVDQGGYDGHLVVAVKNRWILDPTIHQAERPAKGIFLEPLVFEPGKSFFTENEMFPFQGSLNGKPTVYAVYTPVPESTAYVNSPDWTMVRRDDQLVRDLLSRIRI